MFDVEFNKKFEGAINIPIQPKTRQQGQNQSGRHNAISTLNNAGTNTNKYLFFITDKFMTETKIEEDEKIKLKKKLDSMADSERSKFQKQNQTYLGPKAKKRQKTLMNGGQQFLDSVFASIKSVGTDSGKSS